MKVLSPPASGRVGNQVAFKSRFGQAMRSYCIPANRRSAAQQRMRAVFRNPAQWWGGKLSQPQRDRWNLAAAQVMSHPRCGQNGPLIGEQLFTGITSVLGCVGLPPLWEPPARVIFDLSPVRGLVATHDEGGVRLFLTLAAAPAEDIMVFGQAPCSAGRSKRRNVSYLGLLPPPVDGRSEITDLYRAKFGEPGPGTKVFIVTCQQKNGWKGLEQESNEIVPANPAVQQAAASGALTLIPLMYKGCTRDAQGTLALPIPDTQVGDTPETPLGEAAQSASGGGGGAGGESDPPG